MNRLTKKQYEGITRYYFKKKDINKDFAKSLGFNTKKEMMDQMKIIEEKRNNRREYNTSLYNKPKTAKQKYMDKRAEEIVKFANPSFCEITTKEGDDFSIKYDCYNDWNRYAKSCKYAAKIHQYEITIPKGGCTIDCTDGITMVVLHIKRKLGFTYKTGYKLRKKGCHISANPCVLLTNGIHSAHGSNLANAKKSFRRKANKKVIMSSIKSLDDKINARMYQEITGACDFGTNEWLREHGYNRRNSITVRQLLNELKEYDYGRSALINHLRMNGIAV